MRVSKTLASVFTMPLARTAARSTTRAQRWELHEVVEVSASSGAATQTTKFAALTASMAAKAALTFLLLATAAAYSSRRVPIDARRSDVVAAERRRRFNAAAALVGVVAAPSNARAITWKVRDRRPLHSDESRRWRGGGRRLDSELFGGPRRAVTDSRRAAPGCPPPGQWGRR